MQIACVEEMQNILVAFYDALRCISCFGEYRFNTIFPLTVYEWSSGSTLFIMDQPNKKYPKMAYHVFLMELIWNN
jgi:hypothetical protein